MPLFYTFLTMYCDIIWIYFLKYHKIYLNLFKDMIICSQIQRRCNMQKQYKHIAISCKSKDLVDEIAKVFGFNRGMFVEKLIEKAYQEMIEKKSTKE